MVFREENNHSCCYCCYLAMPSLVERSLAHTRSCKLNLNKQEQLLNPLPQQATTNEIQRPSVSTKQHCLLDFYCSFVPAEALDSFSVTVLASSFLLSTSLCTDLDSWQGITDGSCPLETPVQHSLVLSSQLDTKTCIRVKENLKCKHGNNLRLSLVFIWFRFNGMGMSWIWEFKLPLSTLQMFSISASGIWLRLIFSKHKNNSKICSNLGIFAWRQGSAFSFPFLIFIL